MVFLENRVTLRESIHSGSKYSKDALAVGSGNSRMEIAYDLSTHGTRTSIVIKSPVAEQDYEKEKLNERIAKLSGGVAVIQVGAQTEIELKEKKLRVEDALNATKAAIEEGIVVGGGCTLLRLAAKVEAIKDTLENDEQKVLSSDNVKYGYNAATGKYEDLMAVGIIDPTKVVKCFLEHAACS